MRSIAVLMALVTIAFDTYGDSMPFHENAPMDSTIVATAYSANAFYLELGSVGYGGNVSLNYERMFTLWFSGRFGIRSNLLPNSADVLWMLSYRSAASGHGFEAGGGLNVLISGNKPIYVPAISAGYRYQPPSDGFFFRAGGYGMLFSSYLSGYLQLSAGYAF